MRRAASFLAANRVSPNKISILGMCAALGAGLLLAQTGATAWNDRLLSMLAAGLIQLRLLANLLDGMVAIEGKAQSAVGELYNDVPDRVSDCAILIGAGYAAGSSPVLGWASAVLALFVTYLRMLGKACGAGSDFCGPMAKPHRMATLTAACLWLALAPASWRPVLPAMLDTPAPGPMWIALAVICAGSAVTGARRLSRIAARLKAVGNSV